MPQLTKEDKVKLFTTFGGNPKNTGSIQAQIALLTERMNHINAHRQTNAKDYSSHKGLMKLVGQRKRLLTYFKRKNIVEYRVLIEKLNIRK